MKIEIVCPCCDKKFHIILPGSDIDNEGNLDDYKENQVDLEQELFVKYNILLG